MSQDWEPGWQRPDEQLRPDPAALDTQLADLVAYCRAVTGQEQAGASTAHAVLDSARFLLSDPDRLRAWLFALARAEMPAGGEPAAREAFDLVHRYGIRPEDLPLVLGNQPGEADELLAAAEAEHRAGGDWDSRPRSGDGIHRTDAEFDDLVAYCSAFTGREDDAVRAAHTVLGSVRSLLSDPDRLRAWLFAFARREMLADAAPGAQEILDLVHHHGIPVEDLPVVLGIPAAEADDLLAAAEDEYARSAFGFGHDEAGSRLGGGRHPDESWDEEATAWEHEAAFDDGADWDDVFGRKSHRRSADLVSNWPESSGRHAARGARGGLRGALARGPVRAAAAAAIVVAVIAVSLGYLAAANSPPPDQTGQHGQHRPAVAAQTPATTASPVPAATTQSPAPSQAVSAVPPPPPPAPTSPAPSPKPSPKPSPSPTTPSPSPSSPSPSPSPSSPSPSPS